MRLGSWAQIPGAEFRALKLPFASVFDALDRAKLLGGTPSEASAIESVTMGARHFREQPGFGGNLFDGWYVLQLTGKQQVPFFAAMKRLERVAGSARRDVYGWEVADGEGHRPVRFLITRHSGGKVLIANRTEDLIRMGEVVSRAESGQHGLPAFWSSIGSLPFWGLRSLKVGSPPSDSEVKVSLSFEPRSNVALIRHWGNEEPQPSEALVRASRLPVTFRLIGAGVWESSFPLSRDEREAIEQIMNLAAVFGFTVSL